MKDHPVNNDSEQHQPEQQTDTEKEPADFRTGVCHTGHRHQHVTHHWNEPGRTHMPDFEVSFVNPGIQGIQRVDQVQRGTRHPQCF